MSLGAILQSLSARERQAVEDRLTLLSGKSALGRQSVFNLRAEGNLPPEAWDSLVSDLLAVRPDADAVADVIRDFARAWVLKGPAMVPPHPPRFGRVVTFDTFCRKLVARKVYASLKIARRSVRGMIGKAPAVVVRRLGVGFRLERYAMWGTFHPQLAPDPLGGLASAGEIRGILGLDPNETGSLIVFEYNLPDHLPPQVPTVADAYSGAEWSYFFRPSMPGDPHGWTMPWPAFALEPPRPEVIHDSVFGEQLAAPLREILP